RHTRFSRDWSSDVCSSDLNMHEGWLMRKSIVVIGGTTGIGLSAAEAFIQEGANVLAIGRNPESAEQASAALRTAIVQTGDASKEIGRASCRERVRVGEVGR